MLKTRNSIQNDRGVSSVMGTILMVVITVALAAVISAFVFSQVDHVPKNKIVGVEVKRIPLDGIGPATNIIMVKNMGGYDAQYLKQGGPGADCFRVMVNGISASTVKYPASAMAVNYAGPLIGSAQYFQVDPGTDITVVAVFTDDSEYAVWSGIVP